MTHLTFEERERRAYITGDVKTAAILDQALEDAMADAQANADAAVEDLETSLDVLAQFLNDWTGPVPASAVAEAIRQYLDAPDVRSLSALLEDIEE